MKTIVRLAILTGVLAAAPAAQATTTVQGTLDLQDPSLVGDTGTAGSLALVNLSTGGEATGNVTVGTQASDGIKVTPSCGETATPCGAGQVDLDVFALSASGNGRGGTACAGRTYIKSTIDAVTGQLSFTAADATGTTLAQTGMGLASSCIIDFTYSTLRLPTHDTDPAADGQQTIAGIQVSASHANDVLPVVSTHYDEQTVKPGGGAPGGGGSTTPPAGTTTPPASTTTAKKKCKKKKRHAVAAKKKCKKK